MEYKKSLQLLTEPRLRFVAVHTGRLCAALHDLLAFHVDWKPFGFALIFPLTISLISEFNVLQRPVSWAPSIQLFTEENGILIVGT